MNLVLVILSALLAFGAAANAGSRGLPQSATALGSVAAPLATPTPSPAPPPPHYDVIGAGGPS